MRILFVTECYPSAERPQYAIYLEQQAKALCELGHTVDVLIPRLSGKEPSSLTEGEYGGLRVFSAVIKAGRLSRLLWLHSWGSVLDAFDWQQYDAVSVHIASHGILPSVLKNCKKFRIPVIQHFHGLNVWQDYYRKRGLLHRLLAWRNNRGRRRHLRRCAAVVGVSNKVCDVVRERLRGVPVFTVYNGVDLARFTADGKQKNEVFTVICVANLIPIKGHEYLVEAVAKIRSEGTPIRLQLVGVGPEEARLRAMCAALGISDAVEFLGWQAYDEVARLMRNADMFVMPSYFEALGCVYLEAMSVGTLTVGCYGTGADEIIEHRQSGLLVEKRSADDVYSRIRFAIDEPEEAARIARNGIKRAECFSWRSSARSLENAYKYVKNQ